MKFLIIALCLFGAVFANEDGDAKLQKYLDCLATNFDTTYERTNVTFIQELRSCVGDDEEIGEELDCLNNSITEIMDEWETYADCEDKDCKDTVIGCVTVRSNFVLAEIDRIGNLIAGKTESGELPTCVVDLLNRGKSRILNGLDVCECYNN